MKYSFHPEAENELNLAIDYYEECKKGLGYEFAFEVYMAVARARTYPQAWQVIEGDVRRSLVNRFPYGVLYAREKKELLIIAVMHLHQKPGYWKKRTLTHKPL